MREKKDMSDLPEVVQVEYQKWYGRLARGLAENDYDKVAEAIGKLTAIDAVAFGYRELKGTDRI